MLNFNAMKALFGACVLGLAAAGCASTQISVLQPLEVEALSQRTFTWASANADEAPTEGANLARLNAVRSAVEDSLTRKGYVFVDAGEDADLTVSLDVLYDYESQSRTPEEDEDASEGESNVEGTLVRVVRTPAVPVQPTGARHARAQRGSAMARSAAPVAAAQAEVGGLITIAIDDTRTDETLWLGQINKLMNILDLDGFAIEIESDVEELFEGFPDSSGD